MAVVQNKRILLVVFFVLCFISIQVRGLQVLPPPWITDQRCNSNHPSGIARTLKERSNIAHNKEAHDEMFKPKEDEDNASGEVFSMDYTPARRKPPIHN